ncbi:MULTISPECIES: anthranilate synthase component II [Hyphomonas]|uniref:Anthranilate synthase n=1 Tax=Hyphomonas atlantica TaxID=1280948 RepID=A0A059DYQ3_9PROT|nr:MULTISPECIES: aminodeoxychorismate/anthranilate synthase component II [Hyphomonas]KCZ59112.1 anthranilate synthase [Hyphomonas atlantica]MAM07572.1 type 1 glutamine amidotransferase [Hyphomonas sp.]HAE93259.1 aminodeoxychorismate/anthranilate synthase component II [Hyphomonas atlantica]HBH45217.1 aminodeoxychorismate/anthranilate synthase component II [Hyphomonas atlantica]|tara:strand:+ start:441 stop:1019 length:579 start_codon:yes stop_codon:yes gene_type:complete
MSRKKILVIDNYDSFTWNLVHYLEELGAETRVVRNDELTVEEALASDADGVLLSPGPCSPNEAGICVALIEQAPDDLPILGVCLGHQSIGQAFGGEVVTAREIRHGKLSEIRQTGGDLFDGLPETYQVVRYHSLAVKPEDLPDVLVADAFTEDGEVMALHHRTRPVYGVQFHPESILTEHGHALLKNWLDRL